MASIMKRISATGLVQAGPAWLKSVNLQAAAANATLLIQDTTAGGGTDIFGSATLANDSRAWASGDSQGVYFANGIYATLSGASATAAIEYEVG